MFVLLVVKRSCAHLAKSVLSSGVQGIGFWCIQIRKGKSQAVCLGTGCRSQGPKQDKYLIFAFALFSEFYFVNCYFLQVDSIKFL